MKDKIKIYIEKEAFEKFILNEKSFNNLLTIFSEHAVICLNMTDADIDKEWQTVSINGQRGGSRIHKFCIEHNMKRPQSAHNDFENFLKNPNAFLNYSRSVFVLNILPKEAESLRNKLGLIILSKDKLSDDIFQFHIRDSVKKGEEKDGCVDDGWNYFFNLSRRDWLPSNVLVFSDEYLFKNEIRGVNLGIRNLKSIISHLLPEKLGSEFQILVVSPIPNNNIRKAELISKEMTTFVHGLREYSCKITFVFTNAMHTRKALSNYYVMTCDKGFCVFLDSPKNRVHDTNFVDITSNFHSVADSYGTNGYDDTTMCLNELKKCCKEAQEQARAGIKTVLISGDCGPNFKIYNRLLGLDTE